MYRVAWLTCALLTVARARVLERCELARELSALGVRPDHISTWVCIAYHESRFDTSANNPYSGDHGIFQISELFWCGPGKACGLPCSALRDDDISNDLDCALIVHEEHTRLQGNGFLAWVVYPQHCKHNTKKYLVDCDINVKNSVPVPRSRGFNPYVNSYDQSNVSTEGQNKENFLPPYLSIGNIVRENYGKVLDQNRDSFDWYNYKFDNIDELKLPVFNQPSQHISLPLTTSAPRSTTTTTTPAPRRTTTANTPYVPRIKVWRVIETNQFRKKQKLSDTTKQTTTTTTFTQSTKASTAIQLPSTTTRVQTIATTTLSPRLTTTSLKPTTQTTITTATYRTPTSTWTYRVPSSTTTYRPPTAITTTTYKPFSWSTTNKPITWSTANKPITWSTTNKPITWSTTNKPITWSTTNKPITSTTTYKPFVWTTFKPLSAASTTRQWYSTTTQKPQTTSVIPKTVFTTYRPVTTSTIKPSSTTTTRKPTTVWTWNPWSSTTPKTLTITSKAVTTKPPWYTFTSRTATTLGTTKLQPFSQTMTTQPLVFTTKAQNTTLARTTQEVTYSTVKKPQTTTQKPRTTQSIFDLYLNPTKAPQFPSYKFSWGQSKLSIFAGGTTTPATVTQGRGENNKGVDNNLIKRQA